MAQRVPIRRAIAGAVTTSGANDRLEVPIEVILTDGTTRTHTLNVSYKKHALGSYMTPRSEIHTDAAAVNTIANLDLDGFKTSFRDYAFLVARRLAGSDTTTFKPNDAANKMATVSGLGFWSDQDQFGADIHCFPVALAGNATAVELSAQEFRDLKLVTNLAFYPPEKLNRQAVQAAGAAMTRVMASAPLVALLPPAHLMTLQMRIAVVVRESQAVVLEENASRRAAGELQGKITRNEVRAADSYRQVGGFIPPATS